ncbi:2-oxoglutarate dehydrogenase, E2 component, dihydrolipoamide succinyltransferase [Dietzia maris]|uniref:2-oxoglutarate dehydrogenase, E2 component, dihydrolipoamide succinyltransferase n=1 Tax=Dietzia maris TaxID=37915 RepID=UPI0021B00A66|nr:2-oxoglutarate dehydrogenase, E2 component, dihydrolipoamide succinyltransferase [Dietzia maris]MCT1435195.1 2-oxoglutarate dehydrogenase, E2 component, dihydrolipoamide succinyltransferase [Dietzia maris]MCT1522589.1 2-oxoglutarate dehydrogenase, E2 component, dihydrolipoamide succinyltransferase [Dietzia maris]
MAFSVQMPALGESVSEGTVTRWLKKEGDTVEVDEPLLEVSTDKVDTEIPSPAAGTLKKIVADEDETVEIGGELAVIDDGSGGSDDSDESDDDSGSGSGSGSADGADDSDDEADQADDSADDEPAEESAPAKKSSGGGGGGKGTDVVMPELGESVTEGTITKWLKSVGDTVEVDEPLLEVSTDKVDTEIPSPVAGTLQKIVAEEDETVDVGATLAVIGDGDAASDSDDDSGDSGSDSDEQSAEEQNATDAKDEGVDASDEDEVPEDTPETEKKAAAKAESGSGSTSGKKAEQKSEKKAAKPRGSEKSDGGSSGDLPERAEPAAAAKAGSSPYVTPLVRKLAQEHGVDLDSVKGTGIGGRIRKQDVLAAAEGSGSDSGSETPAEEKAPSGGPSKAGVRPELAELRGTTKKANRIRKITAQKTRESLQQTAQLTQVFEVDMTRVAQLRSQVKEQFVDKHGAKLSYLPFYAKAVVEALVSHPNVNASYDEKTNEITYHGSVNLGIAVDTEAGLLSPVIQNAQDLDIPGLAKAIIDLAERARASKLTPDDLQGGTFTITNIGSEGALFDTPILVPPQAAMLGTGAIVRRPVVDADADGESIAIRSMGFMPLTYDHRLIDGADAGRFLTTVKDRLEKAEFDGDLDL